MKDKRSFSDYFFTWLTHNKDSFLYTVKGLFTSLFSFIRRSLCALFNPNPYSSGLQKVKIFQSAFRNTRKKGSIPSLLAILTVIILVISFVLYLPKAQSSGIFFNQSDWSGGAEEGTIATPSDWTKYESADEGIDFSQAGEVTLALQEGLFEDTTNEDFENGTIDETIAVSKGSISLSHPIRLNEYTVGALEDISVTVSKISGSDPWTVSLANSPNLSRVFKSDRFIDSTGKSYKILSVSDTKNSIVVIDSEGYITAPATGSGTVGRWYPSLAAWEDARDGNGDADITASGRNAIERALCYYDGSPDTSNLVIDGWITDAAHYIEVYVPKSERHTGKWVSNAYTLTTTSKSPNILIREDYTKIRGLQIESRSADSHYAISLSGIGLEVSDNIIKGTNDATLQNWNFGILIGDKKITSTAKVFNNIIYHFKSANMRGRGIVGGGPNDTVHVYNNTIYGCDTGIDQGVGGTWVARNNIAYRNTNNFHGSFDATSSNNLSGPAEKSAPGVSPHNGVFVDFIDEYSEDFHLNVLDASAKDRGIDLSLDEALSFGKDIDGDTRSGAWDIGADEAGLSAVITHSIGSNGRDFATLQAWEDAREGDLTRRHVFKISAQSAAFAEGETVANSSGASGTYVKERDAPSASERFMTLDNIKGTFGTGDTLTGGTSGARAKLDAALAVSGVIEKGEAYNDSAFTEGIIIDGSTTNTNSYMILTAAPQSRHTGRAGTGAKIDLQAAKANAVTISDDHAVLEWFETVNWSGANAALKVDNGADGVTIRNNILHDNNAAGTSSRESPLALDLNNDTGLMYAYNNIIYNIANADAKKGAGIFALTSTATRIYNNIIYNAAGVGIDSNQSSAMVAENNICVGNGKDFDGKFSASSDYNISSDASAPGANSLTNKTVSEIAFVSTATEAEDLRTKAGSAAREIRMALSSDGSPDAAARISRYDESWHAGEDAWFPSFSDAYYKAGIFVSRVYDTQAHPFYKRMRWTADVPTSASLVLRVRTSDHPDMVYATEWKQCPILLGEDMADISKVSSVTNGARYIQYRAEFISEEGITTPALQDVTVAYEGYALVGRELVSTPFNTGVNDNVITRLSWDETLHEGVDDVTIQLRTAPDDWGKPGVWSDWLGPEGKAVSYTDASGETAINSTHQDGNNDQWVQYKVQLLTNGLSAPALSDIMISFGKSPIEQTAPPEPELEDELMDDPAAATAALTAAEKAALNVLTGAVPAAGAQLYDVVIKIGDNHHPDPEEDARAYYKEGDVVVVRPAGQDWSDNERRSFLIIQLYLTEEEAKDLTSPEEISTGAMDGSGRPVKKIIRRRARKIDLKKLGLRNAKIERKKFKEVRDILRDKPLKKADIIKIK